MAHESDHPEISVIIPAYKEADNLSHLIPQVAQQLHCRDGGGEIIVVYDESGDGTVELCRDLGASYPVRIVRRKGKRGLSRAVLRGTQEACGKILVVMDADLSHPPARIPDLVAALDDETVDMAIGSRYVEGGGTEDTWGVLRALNSRIATLMARPLVDIADPMAGFFAIRRTTLEAAERLNPVGYKIGLELMVKCHCQNIKEVPIYFRNRKFGESKLTFGEQLKYVWHVLRLMDYKYERWTCFLKFCLVGGTGVAVDLLSLWMLLKLLPFVLARAVAIWLAMSWNFIWNRKFTFNYASAGSIPRQYVMFCGSCAVGAVLNWGISVALSSTIMVSYPMISAIAGIIAGTGFNYAFNRKWTFSVKKD